MIDFLKKRDRILLEMHLGMIIYGGIAWLIGCFFVSNQLRYALSLWFGIFCAILATYHMARTLDKALLCGDAAAKMITAGYVTRYVAVGVILAGTALTGLLDTVVVFIGYMSLKVAAYLQPFTHKFFNKLFHETDPVAQPMEEDASGTANGAEETLSAGNSKE